MYADTMTDSMRNAISETERRRSVQEKYNEENNITPTTIRKRVGELISIARDVAAGERKLEKDPESMTKKELEKLIATIEKQMRAAAAELNFEMAAQLRDRMKELRNTLAEADT
jgi:excinuclease ABC subunit B